MSHPVLIGVLGGLLAFKVIRRMMWHRYGGMYGGCYGRGFRGRRGFRGGWQGRPNFGGPGRFFWLMRELDLDRKQKHAVWGVVQDVKRSIGELRYSGVEGLESMVDALGQETFDRASVDAAAQKQGDAMADVRQKIVSGLERIHAILTPEQRERLRYILRGEDEIDREDPQGPEGGPYRTSV